MAGEEIMVSSPDPRTAAVDYICHTGKYQVINIIHSWFYHPQWLIYLGSLNKNQAGLIAPGNTLTGLCA